MFNSQSNQHCSHVDITLKMSYMVAAANTCTQHSSALAAMAIGTQQQA